jgi:ankyrin repeat protein
MSELAANELDQDEMVIVEAMGSAAAAGDVPALSALVEKHSTLVNKRRTDGWTALHLAGFFGHVDAMRYLLAHGAHTEVRSDNPTSNMPLHAAIAGAASAEAVALLLDAGADANSVAGHGVTPLHLAGARGTREIADQLLAHDADLAARMDDGTLASDLAAAREHPEVAAYLTQLLETRGSK